MINHKALFSTRKGVIRCINKKLEEQLALFEKWQNGNAVSTTGELVELSKNILAIAKKLDELESQNK